MPPPPPPSPPPPSPSPSPPPPRSPSPSPPPPSPPPPSPSPGRWFILTRTNFIREGLPFKKRFQLAWLRVYEYSSVSRYQTDSQKFWSAVFVSLSQVTATSISQVTARHLHPNQMVVVRVKLAEGNGARPTPQKPNAAWTVRLTSLYGKPRPIGVHFAHDHAESVLFSLSVVEAKTGLVSKYVVGFLSGGDIVSIPPGQGMETAFTLTKATAAPEGAAGVDRLLYRLLITGPDGAAHYGEELFECALNPRCCRRASASSAEALVRP